MEQLARLAFDRGLVERPGRTAAAIDAPRSKVTMPGLNWYAPPLQLYLQQSASLLLCGQWVGAQAPRGAFPILFHSKTGITMTFELAAQEPPDKSSTIYVLPHERLCERVVVLSLHVGQERFAAMRRACEHS